MLETIISYIATGQLKDTDISKIVGCSQSYISQIRAREDYDSLIADAKLKIESTEDEKAKDKKYSSLEDKVLDHLEEHMPFADYNEVIRLMEILNKRKAPPAPVINGNVNINNQQVVLNIPQAAIPEIQLNNRNEVIGINDQSLAPMGASGVRRLFMDLKQKQKDREAAAEAKIVEAEIVESPKTLTIQEM